MSASSVVTTPQARVGYAPKAGAPAAAAGRTPSLMAQEKVHVAIRALLFESFDFREAMSILRNALLKVALDQCGRSRKKCSGQLHISRELLRRYLARTKEQRR